MTCLQIQGITNFIVILMRHSTTTVKNRSYDSLFNQKKAGSTSQYYQVPEFSTLKNVNAVFWQQCETISRVSEVKPNGCL